MFYVNLSLLLTFALTVGTLWLGVNRANMSLQSNWPLLYYTLLLVLANWHPGVLEPKVVYVAVIAALLLRFEFMNRRFIAFVKTAEIACFGLIGWRLFVQLLRDVS